MASKMQINIDFIKSLLDKDYMKATPFEQQNAAEEIDKLIAEKSIFSKYTDVDILPPLAETKPGKLRKQKDSGEGWFRLKSASLTEENKNELQLLNLRNYITPGRFYKRGLAKAELPEFFQLGEAIVHPAQFYAEGRAKRKMGLADILREDEETKNSIGERFKKLKQKRKQKKYYKLKNFKKSRKKKSDRDKLLFKSRQKK